MIIDKPAPLSQVEAFAVGGYTFASDAPLREKVIVVANYFFSVITGGLYPAIAFLVCFINDLRSALESPSDSVKELPPPSANDLAFVEQCAQGANQTHNILRSSSPTSQPGMELLKIAAPHMADIRTMTATLATGSITALYGLTGANSVESRLGNLSPFVILAAILSEEALTDQMDIVRSRPTMNFQWITLGFVSNVNLYYKFCADISKQRRDTDPSKWQRQVKALEDLCGLQRGTLEGGQDTRKFVNYLIDNRATIHATIQQKKAAALSISRQI